MDTRVHSHCPSQSWENLSLPSQIIVLLTFDVAALAWPTPLAHTPLMEFSFYGYLTHARDS